MSEKIPYIDLKKIQEETARHIEKSKKLARCITIRQAIAEGYLDNRFHCFDDRLDHKITVYPKEPAKQETPEEKEAFEKSFNKIMSQAINCWGY